MFMNEASFQNVKEKSQCLGKYDAVQLLESYAIPALILGAN